jgi:hypothetical protein
MAEESFKKEDAPECCRDCLKWEQFGKNCWIYWERKKHCTQKVTQF